MADLDEETETAISTEEALKFVDRYYKAMESYRATIASLYVKPTISADGKSLPSIVYNGHIYSSGDALQKAFLEEMPPTHFDIQSVDSHCLNPSYLAEGAHASNPGFDINMSILVAVSGSVRLEAKRSAPLQGFSESLILVPNAPTTSRFNKGKPIKDYLVQSQTFRLVS